MNNYDDIAYYNNMNGSWSSGSWNSLYATADDTQSFDSECYEYECDTASLPSLYSYSSEDTSTLETHDFDYDKVYTPRRTIYGFRYEKMSSIAEDFEFIQKAMNPTTDDVPYTLLSPRPMSWYESSSKSSSSCHNDIYEESVKGSCAVAAEESDDERSKQSDETLSLQGSVAKCTWKSISKPDAVNMNEIINMENRERIKRNANRQRNQNAVTTTTTSPHRQQHHQREQKPHTNNRGARKKNGYERNSDNSDATNTNRRSAQRCTTIPSKAPKRRSLLLEKNDKDHKDHVTIQNANHRDTSSVSSSISGNQIVMSRLCKFGKSCTNKKSNCGRCHGYHEWRPPQCKWVGKAEHLKSCHRIHENESKMEYLKRMVNMENTFYSKNKEIYLKNFRFS